MKDLAQRLEKRLVVNNTCGRTLTLKVKYSDFQLITRRKTFKKPISDWKSMLKIADELLLQTELGARKVRLLGISLSQLQKGSVDPPPEQPLLFE